MRDRVARRERRPADRTQIDRELEMPLDAERARDVARRLELARVPLAVADCQREEREALRLRDRSGGVGIQATAQQEYCAHLVNW